MLGDSRGLLLTWCAVVGLFVGSFLNVAIFRLPIEGMSVSRPRRSFCPACKRQLTWQENIPLLSWLFQRGRCRGCSWRIPWRYPLVEALTALVWLAAAWATPSGEWGLLAVRILVLSGLIVATFVDFERFEIPDEISIGGMVIAPICALLVPKLHSSTWIARFFDAQGEGVGRFGSLLACLLGMAVGAGILMAIGALGSRVYGRDAMGLGDVKLLGAAGGFIGPGGCLVALMMASLVASVAGVLNVARFAALIRARDRERGRRRRLSRVLATARILGRYVPFGPYLALGIGIVLLYWDHVRAVLGWGAAA